MPTLRRGSASISYLRTGSGPAVLLVQGAGVVGNGWRPQVDSLSKWFTAVTFDNRGIGASTDGRQALSIETLAEDALAIMDAERIDRFHLAGHSMGGLIAQQVALAAPTRVASLSLLCTFVRGSQASRVTLSMLVTALRMRIGSRPMRRNAFLELVMPAEYLRQRDRVQLAEELAPLFGYDLAYQPSVVMQQLRAMARFDVSARLAELGGIPTLVISAAQDRVAPAAYGRPRAAAIPNAQYVEWPGAGHGVTIQCAEGINEMLARHFAAAEKTPLSARGTPPAAAPSSSYPARQSDAAWKLPH
jgi:pimeloyl-ACP methyl ester carboxylesterase